MIFWGLVKKVVVADNLAVLVNDLFGRWQSLDGGSCLLAVYAFAFQIYGDFSGYTDIARGVAKCLGFEIPLNFNLPYFATSPKEFWNRWHISLSRWLRDYLYIPLGGSHSGTLLTYRNLMLTMVLGGLWRTVRPGRSSRSGACTTGFCWSSTGWHRRGWPRFSLVIRSTAPLLGRPADVRHLPPGVQPGWLIFRANTLEQAIGMLTSIAFRPAIPAAAYLAPVAFLIIPLWVVQLVQFSARDLNVIARTPWYVRSVFYTACFYAIVLAGQFGGQQCIYFQF